MKWKEGKEKRRRGKENRARIGEGEVNNAP